MLVQRLAGLLNRGLADSQRARAICSALAGKSLRVVVAGTPWEAVLQSDGSQLALLVVDPQATRSGEADVIVRGTPLSLLQLAGEQRRAVIQRGDASIEGNGELAEQFMELLTLLRPDIEHEIGERIGLVPAHLLVSGLRTLQRWTRSTAQSALQTGADYLAHEKRDLVPQAEAEHYLRETEQLRERLDRLDVMVQQLEQGRGATR